MTTINTLYRRIAWAMFFQGVCTLLALLFNDENPVNALHVMGFVGFFLTVCLMAYDAPRLFQTLPGRIPLLTFLVGTSIIIVGTIVDIGATIIHSPDLAREGNMFVLMLFSEHYSLAFIYCYILSIDILNWIVEISLWGCFLKLYPTIIQSIPYKNIGTTLKWLLGIGKTKSWKELFTAQADLSFLLPAGVFVIFSHSLYRFYMACMWFDLVPHYYETLLGTISLASFTALLFFTHYKVKQWNQMQSHPVQTNFS